MVLYFWSALVRIVELSVQLLLGGMAILFILCESFKTVNTLGSAGVTQASAIINLIWLNSATIIQNLTRNTKLFDYHMITILLLVHLKFWKFTRKCWKKYLFTISYVWLRKTMTENMEKNLMNLSIFLILFYLFLALRFKR